MTFQMTTQDGAGRVVEQQVDNGDGTATVTRYTDGKPSSETIPYTAPEKPPLTDNEQLATLLAVKGIISVDEAAAVTKRAKADLIAEAEAWAVAADVLADEVVRSAVKP